MRSIGLDLSKLQPDGSHYVVIDLVMPFSLGLPDGNYHIALNDNERPLTVQLVLQKQRGLVATSLGGGAKSLADTSLALIYVPIRRADPDSHNDRQKVWSSIMAQYERYHLIAVRAMNKLVAVYRLNTGECQLKPITALDDFNLTLLFSKLPPDSGRSEFDGDVVPFTLTDNVVPRTLVLDIPDSVIDQIRDELRVDHQVSLSDELLLNACDFLDQGNYRLAIIEAETGFETGLLRHILDYYRDQPAKLRTIEHINSFVNLINHKLFQQAFIAAQKKFAKNESYYDNWHKQVWEIRGDLVHGKLPGVSYMQAATAIDCVEGTLEYLLNRPRTQPRRYAAYKYDRAHWNR